MIAFLCLMALSCVQAPPSAIRLEAEDAQLDGPKVATTRPGFSGRGYVTDITKEKARIVWRVKAPPGIYDARLCFATPLGAKGYEISVNGESVSGLLPATGDAFQVRQAGKVELKSGENVVAIERGWGYYDVDYLELVPASPPPKLKTPSRRLSDPNATPATRALFNKLIDSYGKGTLSGQYVEEDNAFIRETVGKTPAIFGGDLMDYSPSRVDRGGYPKGATESFIAAAKKGQILTLSWHWNAPAGLIDKKTGDKDLSWYKGFYTEASTFDVAKAMADPSSQDYKLLLRDIDAIAVELKKVAAANVPVLWRPLHEASGGWFWWGAKGPQPCLKLWRLLRERLTDHFGLHNLIWVWNSVEPEWYPGDDEVDVVATDDYPDDRFDSLSAQWEPLFSRFDGKKLLALGEFPGAPDVDRMFKFGVRWSYFVSWVDPGVGPRSNPPGSLERIYHSPRVLNK